MDSCPFCDHPVAEPIARFGGTCPQCFGEVPGDEAATDQGETPVPISRPSLFGFAVVGGMLVGLLGTLVVGAALWWRAAPRVAAPTLDFDQPLPEVVAIDPAPAAGRARSGAASVDQRAAAYATGEETWSAGGGTDEIVLRSAPARTRPTEVRRSGTGARRSGGAPAGGPLSQGRAGSQAPTFDLSVSGGTVGRDDHLVLDDELAIRMMIGDRLRRGIRELRGCYDRRLKQSPDLQGRWRLTFTVSSEGRAANVVLAGLDRRDRTFERCVRDHITRRWSFAKVAKPTDVSKTLTFRPAR